jgi:hypothetical protein
MRRERPHPAVVAASQASTKKGFAIRAGTTDSQLQGRLTNSKHHNIDKPAFPSDNLYVSFPMERHVLPIIDMGIKQNVRQLE